MPISFGQVGPLSSTSANEAATNPLLQGKQGELLAAQVHGKYYSQCVRGNVFWGSTAIGGLTLTLVTATTNVGLLLWNPQGSGKNCVLINCTVTPSVASSAGSGYGYGWVTNAGSALGTLAPLSAFAAITATRGTGLLQPPNIGSSAALLGGGATFSATGGTPTFMRGMGASVGTGATTAPSIQPIIREDFEGSIIVPPNIVFIVGMTVTGTAQSATVVSLVWEEVPI